MPSTGALDQYPDNLPRQLTSFIGRERELQELTGLLERSRLLTLTGPGGSGKTRLGLQLAAEVAGGFPDGVSFVALAPVGNPDLVLSSIAQGIGLRDVGDRPLLDRLRSHLENAGPAAARQLRAPDRSRSRGRAYLAGDGGAEDRGDQPRAAARQRRAGV